MTTARIVAVTGLTGFIGRRLAVKLAASSFKTRAIVRRPPGGLDLGFAPHQVGLDDVDALAEILVGVDAIVHLAGSVRGSRPADFAAANQDAVANLCQAAARQQRPPAFLLVSSLAASRPDLSHYAASKRAGEQVLFGYSQLAWTILRPPVVYGPGEVELKLLFRLMRRGLTLVPGNRHQRLSFLHVDDLADAILCWLRDPERCRHGQFSIDDGVVNGYDWPSVTVAAGATHSLTLVLPKRMLHLVAWANVLLSRLFGYAPMLTPGKVRELAHDRWVGRDDCYGVVTGWHPRHQLASGLEQTFSGS